MWFIFFEKLNGETKNTIAVHSNCTTYAHNGDETSNWLVTEEPFDYNLNYLYDRNGKVFEIKQVSE